MINYKNKTLTNPKDIANALNDHYITIATKTKKTIPHYNNPQTFQQPNHPQFKLQLTTTKTIEKILKKMNTNKASDIYKIKPIIIKDLRVFLTPILTTLYNRAITEKQYPDSLKTTKLIELYKSKDKTLPTTDQYLYYRY